MPETNRDEIAKLETLYASNPEGRVFTHLAEAYRKAGEYDRARAILEQGLGKHPGYASAYVVLGRVFFDLNDMPQATDSFRRVLKLDPHNLVALRSLGDIERGAGHSEEALGYFQELRHLDPSNAEIEGIIAELKSAPAAAPEVVAPAPEPETQPEPESWEAPAEAVFEESAEATFEAPTFEPPAADFEPTDLEFETPSVADNLPEFDMPAPDISELVSSDLDIDWGTPDTSDDSALPGDLAGFADLMVTSSANDAFDTEPVADLPLIEPAQEPEAETTSPMLELPPPSAELVTETMARLYRDQGLFERSAEIYRALLRERPGDWSLQAGLQEVENLAGPAHPEARPAMAESSVEDEPLPFLATAPEAATEPEAVFEPVAFEPETLPPETFEPAAAAPAEPEAEPASPWVDPAPVAPTEAPGLYSWEEAAKEEPQPGAPIGTYFKSLLSWRPHGNGAQSSFAPAPEVEEEPAYLELDLPADTAQEPFFEEPVMALEPEPKPDESPAPPATPAGVPEPPATPPDELMPWEEPASPSMPDAPVIPMPPATPGAPVMPVTPPAPLSASGDNPVDAAFDEWFNTASPTQPLVDPLPPPVAQPADLPAAHQPAAPNLSETSEPARGDAEDDDDLEMFRSWLQSLKK